MLHLRSSRVLRVGSQAIFVGIILFFLLRAVARSWATILAYPWQLRPGPLIGSFLLQFVAAILWATTWYRMTTQSGSSIEWAESVRVYTLSNLAKYVPGSIWVYVSRAYLGKPRGLTGFSVGVTTIWEVGIAIVASLLLTVTIIPSFPYELPPGVVRLLLASALVSFILLVPPVFERWIPYLQRRQAGAPLPVYRWRDFGVYLAAASLTHILVGTAFYLFASSLVALPPASWWTLVGGWSFSSVAGLLVVVAPLGLGVKEGLLVPFLNAYMPMGVAAVVALSSRLWLVAAELIAAGGGLMIAGRSVQRYSERGIDSQGEVS